jgi:hypothetical protein
MLEFRAKKYTALFCLILAVELQGWSQHGITKKYHIFYIYIYIYIYINKIGMDCLHIEI